MRIFFSLLFCCLFSSLSFAARPLSESAKFSLITCSPGTELYNCFGHSALHLSDPANGIELVYNYGTFDFDTPNFGLKFIQGKLEYALSRAPFGPFMQTYVYEERGVYEQEILLSAEKKQALFDALEARFNSPDRYYMYDFFYDNCATQIRDLGQLLYAEDFILPQADSSRSFRSYLAEYTAPSPWLDLGIKVILGRGADKRPSVSEQMFLPDYLAQHLTNSQTPAGPFLGEKKELLPWPAAHQESIKDHYPLLLFTLLAALFFAIAFVFPNYAYVADRLLLAVVGLAGAFLCFMWWGTDHAATQWNLNILWLSPLYLPLLFGLKKVKTNKFFALLHGLLLLSYLLALLNWLIAWQAYPLSLLPIFAYLSYRLYVYKWA